MSRYNVGIFAAIHAADEDAIYCRPDLALGARKPRPFKWFSILNTLGLAIAGGVGGRFLWSGRNNPVVDQSVLSRAEEILAHAFDDRQLLRKALIHASLADSRLQSNERLEFLGDAVLGMVVCEYLHDNFDTLLEGELTKIKSNVVSRRTCAEIGDKLNLEEVLQLGKGLSSREAIPQSVIAAVYESLIGAIYVDGGLDAARRFILAEMEPLILKAAKSGHQYNFKSVLQQTVQQQFEETPQYMLLDEKGPDHAKCFEVCVAVGAHRFPSSWGPSKKEAEQQAALQALIELGHAHCCDAGEVHLRPRCEIAAEEDVASR